MTVAAMQMADMKVWRGSTATADALDATIAFCEQLQGTTCARRVLIAETGVVAARVGTFLILAGDGAAMTAAR
jgi:hypothetical protein